MSSSTRGRRDRVGPPAHFDLGRQETMRSHNRYQRAIDAPAMDRHFEDAMANLGHMGQNLGLLGSSMGGLLGPSMGRQGVGEMVGGGLCGMMRGMDEMMGMMGRPSVGRRPGDGGRVFVDAPPGGGS